MNQVSQINKYDDSSKIQSNDSNKFEACEQVVEALCEQGLPRAYNPSTFITKIANGYGISTQEARTCLKLAIKQLESTQVQQEEKPQEKLYAQSGYFYPSSTNSSQNGAKKDGMDSLSSLGSYNRLMFGLR